MDISRQLCADGLNVIVKGRLDGYWADHLAKELAEVLREGVHDVRLDLSGVNYLSSAGIGTLVEAYKEFEAIQGSFTVVHPSTPVRTLLTMTKLDALLIAGASPTAPAPAAPLVRQLERSGVVYEIFDLAPGESLRCVTVGNPSLLEGCHFRAEHCQAVRFPASSFAVGLGAFGNDFPDCRGRFGEFLSVAGAAAYLPTDGTGVPDYMLAAGTFVPELQVLYCTKAEGRFAHLARFEANKQTGPVKLSALVDAGFEIAQSEIIGLAIVAETAGLLGVSLRRSPAVEGDGHGGVSLFAFPGVREWLSYSAERTHERSLALVAGVAARNHSSRTAEEFFSMLRPLASGSWPQGHFHAAAFSYRPLKKGPLDLKVAVATLFEAQGLQSVTHLINDTREISGAGESEFARGACWIGPVAGANPL
jgi:anti-anti-sigma factor